MPLGKETKGVIDGENIYLFGGYRDKLLNEVEVYNLRTGEWKKMAALIFAVSRPGVVCIEKKAYIFENGVIQVYDLEENVCRAYQIDLRLTGSELFYRDGQLYILGGCKLEGYNMREPSPYLYSIDLAAFDKTSLL